MGQDLFPPLSRARPRPAAAGRQGTPSRRGWSCLLGGRDTMRVSFLTPQPQRGTHPPEGELSTWTEMGKFLFGVDSGGRFA